MPFVVDASKTLAWLFREQGHEEGVPTSLADDYLVVPTLWALEIANTIRGGEKSGRITLDESHDLAALLLELPVRVDVAEPDQVMNAVLRLAREQDLTVYDAAYLELALRQGLPIATLDGEIQAAARRLNAELI